MLARTGRQQGQQRNRTLVGKTLKRTTFMGLVKGNVGNQRMLAIRLLLYRHAQLVAQPRGGAICHQQQGGIHNLICHAFQLQAHALSLGCGGQHACRTADFYPALPINRLQQGIAQPGVLDHVAQGGPVVFASL